MHISCLAVGFACIGLVPVAARILLPRQANSDSDYPVVPSYTFAMPIDHFSPSDTRTYQNRYYVNDTYYQPGGPVIVYGYGESSLTPSEAAYTLAEYGDYLSAPIRLAKLVNGVVIGWEHRYYGQSVPVALDDLGVAVEGAEGYKFLNIEQAMEDLVYFANRVNQSTFSDNRVVKTTETLDPYNTPWIYVGGSYSGVLAAFLRIRNPEIFYASWASSSPVEARYDGTLYYNQIYRTLPSNCSTDIKAVLQSFDEIAVSDDQAQVTDFINTAIQSNSDYGLSGNEEWSAALAGLELGQTFMDGFQYYGPSETTDLFCDKLETFNGDAYLKSNENGDIGTIFSNPLDDPFNGSATDNGVVAAYGDNGIKVAQAAYFYAMQNYSQNWAAESSGVNASARKILHRPSANFSEEPSYGDQPSWTWQTLSQFGFQRGYNETSNHGMQLVLNISDNEVDRNNDIQSNFPHLDPSTIPSGPNVSAPMQYGGWKMTPSNVMFTNGELDPWRAFSVMSIEKEAPKRTVVQTLPKCNEAPADTDIFGLLFENQVHCSDLGAIPPNNLPIMQAAQLFAKAYNSWTPCFNKTRDDLRNTKGSDQSDKGSGKVNLAGRYRVSQAGLWAIIVASMII